MLYKLNSLQHPGLIDIANAHDCGSVYPLSIAEGIQEGVIFTDSLQDYEKVLFWAHSGFVYLSGNIDEHFSKHKHLCGHVIIKMLRLKKWQKN